MRNTKILLPVLLVILISFSGMGQTPSHFPNPRPTPVDFFENTASVIFYIVIPVVVTVLYFVWKRNVARQQKE
jgi:heme/copper-type cytochrome/quinol oxidase subunit 2